MRLTDPSLLPVPGGENTGATALFLQSFAERTEAVLSAQYDALNQHLTSPMFIMTNSGVSNISASFNVLDSGSTINLNTDTYRTNNGPALSRALFRTGLWHLGFYMNASVVGAVNTNTYRRGHLRVTANDLLINQDTVADDFSYSTAEKGNTPQGLTAEFFFYIPPDTPRAGNGAYATWGLSLSHGNTGSQMSIAAGSARAWGMWVSDDDLIREV